MKDIFILELFKSLKIIRFEIFIVIFLFSSLINAADYPSYDFSSDKQLKSWKAEGGHIATSSVHTLDAKKSLCWDYVPKSVLSVKTNVPYKKQVVKSVVKLDGMEYPQKTEPMIFDGWFYTEEFSKSLSPAERLKNFFRIEFYKNNKLCCWFKYYPSEKGWQHLVLTFDRHMLGKPVEGMDEMRIVAPSVSGKLYIAQVTPAAEVRDARFIRQSLSLYDMPGNPGRGQIQHPQSSRFVKSTAPLKTPTKFERAAISEIRKRFETFALKKADKLTKAQIDAEFSKLQQYYKKLNLTRSGKNINGPILKGGGWPVSPTRDYGQKLLAMARLYRSIEDKAVRAELRKMSMMMAEYSLKFRLIPIAWYTGEGFNHACYLWRKELKEANLLEPMIEHLKENYAFKRFYEPNYRHDFPLTRGADVDYIRINFVPVFFLLLMMDDEAVQVRDLKAFSKWMSVDAFNWAPGLSDGFKPDGTVFHHGIFIDGYGIPASDTAARVIYFLNHTPFAITKAAHARMRHYMLCQAFMFQGNTMPGMAFGSKGASRTRRWFPERFLYMALAGSPDGKSNIDAELASIFLRKYDIWLKNQAGKKYTKDNDFIKNEAKKLSENFKEAPVPNGNKSFPYACGMIQRRKDWLFAVRGRSRYIHGYESWGADFTGMYNCGSYLIQYPTRKIGRYLQDDNGRSSRMEGWDFRKFPGMTMVQLPWKRIHYSNVRWGQEFGEYVYSDKRMVGGVSSSSGNGAFVFQHRGPLLYDLKSFTALKTNFFFDDIVVCLGSDIQNTEDDYSTYTTLFQNCLLKNSKKQYPATLLNGKLVHGLNETDISGKDNNYFLSVQNNAFYIPAGQKLTLKRSTQETFGKKTTKADFECAWIDHGKAPKEAKYRYFIQVDSNAEKIKEFATAMNSKTPPIKVLRQDRWAHVVHNEKSKETGYVIMHCDYLLNIRKIKGVSRPCALWTRENSDSLELSICDPDLRFYHGAPYGLDFEQRRRRIDHYSQPWYRSPSLPSKIKVILDGQWKLNGDAGNIEFLESGPDRTVVEILCRDGLSNQFKLIKKGVN